MKSLVGELRSHKPCGVAKKNVKTILSSQVYTNRRQPGFGLQAIVCWPLVCTRKFWTAQPQLTALTQLSKCVCCYDCTAQTLCSSCGSSYHCLGSVPCYKSHSFTCSDSTCSSRLRASPAFFMNPHHKSHHSFILAHVCIRREVGMAWQLVHWEPHLAWWEGPMRGWYLLPRERDWGPLISVI